MSFALTTAAVIARMKSVTRRVGWLHAQPGMRLLAVDKLRTKEAKRLAVIEIVSVRREPLNWITSADLRREGLAEDRFFGAYGPVGSHYGVNGFVHWFAATHHCAVTDEITRIEFRYLDCPCGKRATCLSYQFEEFVCCDDCCLGSCWPLERAS